MTRNGDHFDSSSTASSSYDDDDRKNSIIQRGRYNYNNNMMMMKKSKNRIRIVLLLLTFGQVIATMILFILVTSTIITTSSFTFRPAQYHHPTSSSSSLWRSGATEKYTRIRRIRPVIITSYPNNHQQSTSSTIIIPLANSLDNTNNNEILVNGDDSTKDRQQEQQQQHTEVDVVYDKNTSEKDDDDPFVSKQNGDVLLLSSIQQQLYQIQQLEQQQQQQQQPTYDVTANGASTSAAVAATVAVNESGNDESNNNYKLVLYDLTRAGLLGVITGASVAIFKLLIESLRLEAYSLPFLIEPLIAALVPAFGGLIVAILALFGPFPPGLRGIIKEADNDTKTLFNVDDDEMNNTRKYNPIAFLRKTTAAIFTLGTGCSLGPEGPSVEIGVSLSRALTSTMNQIPTDSLNEIMKHNRLLLSCGGAAGVAAGFNAPIAGIFFALEVIQGTFQSLGSSNKNNGGGGSVESENLISTKGGISSIVLSAVLAALVSKTLLGDELVFKVTEYSLKTPLVELPLYLLLGSLCGILAFCFSQLSNTSKQFFDGKFGPQFVQDTMTALPTVVKPVLGGLFCGLIGTMYPQILFFGYETLNNLLSKSSLSTELLLSLLVIKMITTSVASGSGLVGGTFAPSLFFGGMLGASFHNIFEYLLVQSQPGGGLLFGSSGVDGLADVPAYAMIGSASVLAALFRAPLTASLLLFECTREYEIILPLMASAGLASVVGDVLELWFSNRKDQQIQLQVQLQQQQKQSQVVNGQQINGDVIIPYTAATTMSIPPALPIDNNEKKKETEK